MDSYLSLAVWTNRVSLKCQNAATYFSVSIAVDGEGDISYLHCHFDCQRNFDVARAC